MLESGYLILFFFSSDIIYLCYGVSKDAVPQHWPMHADLLDRFSMFFAFMMFQTWNLKKVKFTGCLLSFGN